MGSNKVKNPGDMRFLKSRRRIFKALNHLIIERRSLAIRPVELYKTAGVCKATFYHHFRGALDAFTIESQELLDEFQDKLDQSFGSPSPHNSPDFRHLFTLFSVFILRHEDFFMACFSSYHIQPIEKIFKNSLRPFITAEWRRFSTTIDNRIYSLYVHDAFPILYDWCQNNFSQTDIDHVVNTLNAHTQYFAQNLHAFSRLATIQTRPKPTANGKQQAIVNSK